MKTRAFVTRLLFEPSSESTASQPTDAGPAFATRTSLHGCSKCARVWGVEFADDARACVGSPSPRVTVRARREVVLCAGAIASPQLLMVSGVGPTAQLQAAGVACRVDLPGVGANLQDHLFVGVGREVTVPGTSQDAHNMLRAAELVNYVTRGKGMLASQGVECLAFTDSVLPLPRRAAPRYSGEREKEQEGKRVPDLQLHFFPRGGKGSGAVDPTHADKPHRRASRSTPPRPPRVTCSTSTTRL